MRASVRAAFHGFSKPLEGRVPFMYLDSAEPRGLVTVGVGNLCPLDLAVTLPFTIDGRRATRAEIEAGWRAVDGAQARKKNGGGTFGDVTRLRLSDEAIDQLVTTKLGQTEAALRTVFPDWDNWPADAQLFGLSWAWAVGPHARYPKMVKALNADDFEGARAECIINPQRGTIVERNKRNLALLRNAARVRAAGLDPEVLHWPTELATSAGPEANASLPASVRRQ